MSIGRPTHPSTYPADICWNRRGGLYTPRTGNSHGELKKKKAGRAKKVAGDKPVAAHVQHIVVPKWARKYL